MDESEQRYVDLSQRVGMVLLDAFDAACRSAGVQYYLFAGTLLGAVRHCDWIPWDDDIDVAMLREDFETFRKVAGDLLPERIRFSDARSDASHLTPIPRLLHLDATREAFARTRRTTPPEVRHVALDIFVLDRAPQGALAQRLWRARIRLLEKLVMASGTRMRDVFSTGASPTRKIVEAIGVLVSRTASHQRWAERHFSASSHYRTGRGGYVCSTNDFSVPKRALLLDIEDFHPAEDVAFAGRSLPAPRRADQVLSQLYGPTFLSPPPESEQRPIHFRNGIVVDLGNGIERAYPNVDGS